MKRTCFLIALFLIALFAAAYTALWYHGAKQAKELMDQKIAKAAAFFDAQGYTLKDEGVFIKGFPFNFEAEIKSPSLKEKSDHSNPKNEVESVWLAGDLTLVSNLIGTKFSIKKNGNGYFQIKNDPDDLEKSREFIVTGEASSTFSVEDGSYLEAMKNPFKGLFNDLMSHEGKFLVGKKGSFYAKDLKVIDSQNPSLVLFDVEKSDIQYEINEKDGKVSFIKIGADIKGLNADTLLFGSAAYIPGRERSLREIALLMSFPKPGKTDIVLDFEAEAPFSKFQELDKLVSLNDLPPFNFDLKNLTVSNNFGDGSQRSNFSFKDAEDGAKRFSFNHFATSQISDQKFENLKNALKEFIGTLPICEENINLPEKSNSICNTIQDLIPEMNTFGKIVVDIDGNFDIANPKDVLDKSKLLINQFNYFCDLYGMKSGGAFSIEKDNIGPSSYKIELLNYQSLFQDLFHYLSKVQKVLPYINKDAENLPKISEDHIKWITEYLNAISDQPEANLKNITITIKIDGSNQISVGTLSQEEFIKKTMRLNFLFKKDFLQQQEEMNKLKSNQTELIKEEGPNQEEAK